MDQYYATPTVTTPCPGMLMRRTAAGYAVVKLHYSADPEKDASWVAKERPKFSGAWWDQEMEINAHARSGQLVYPEFDPAIHVIPDSQIPGMMCRFMAIDPHPRTPHAMLWVGIDRWSDWYVYRELWPSKMYGRAAMLKDDEEDESYTIREYAETIAALESNRIEWRHAETDREYGSYKRSERGERIILRLMDQAGKGFRASGDGEEEEYYSTRYTRFGISCSDPVKSHQSGEDAIRALLKPRHHDLRGLWPRLHIASSCLELQLEFRRYRYKPTKRWTEDRELKQDGVDARSHLLDDLRYLAVGKLSYVDRLAS